VAPFFPFGAEHAAQAAGAAGGGNGGNGGNGKGGGRRKGGGGQGAAEAVAQMTFRLNVAVAELLSLFATADLVAGAAEAADKAASRAKREAQERRGGGGKGSGKGGKGAVASGVASRQSPKGGGGGGGGGNATAAAAASLIDSVVGFFEGVFEGGGQGAIGGGVQLSSTDAHGALRVLRNLLRCPALPAAARARVLAAVGTLLRQSSPHSAMKRVCVCFVLELLAPRRHSPGGGAAVSVAVRQELEAARGWLRGFPLLLWRLRAEQPGLSTRMLALLCDVARRGGAQGGGSGGGAQGGGGGGGGGGGDDDAASLSVLQLACKDLVPFFYARGKAPAAATAGAGIVKAAPAPARRHVFGPFCDLPALAQRHAVALVFFLPALSAPLLRALAACANQPQVTTPVREMVFSALLRRYVETAEQQQQQQQQHGSAGGGDEGAVSLELLLSFAFSALTSTADELPRVALTGRGVEGAVVAVPTGPALPPTLAAQAAAPPGALGGGAASDLVDGAARVASDDVARIVGTRLAALGLGARRLLMMFGPACAERLSPGSGGGEAEGAEEAGDSGSGSGSGTGGGTAQAQHLLSMSPLVLHALLSALSRCCAEPKDEEEEEEVVEVAEEEEGECVLPPSLLAVLPGACAALLRRCAAPRALRAALPLLVHGRLLAPLLRELLLLLLLGAGSAAGEVGAPAADDAEWLVGTLLALLRAAPLRPQWDGARAQLAAIKEGLQQGEVATQQPQLLRTLQQAETLVFGGS